MLSYSMHLPLTAVSVFVSHTWNRAASLCHTAVFHLEPGPFSTITDTIWYKTWGNRTTKVEVSSFTPGCVYKKRTKRMWSIYVDNISDKVLQLFFLQPQLSHVHRVPTQYEEWGKYLWFQTIIPTPFSRIDTSCVDEATKTFRAA